MLKLPVNSPPEASPCAVQGVYEISVLLGFGPYTNSVPWPNPCSHNVMYDSEHIQIGVSISRTLGTC